MLHVPEETIVTVDPDIVQTPGLLEAKPTVNPELAVAEIPNGAAPATELAIAGKERV